MQSQDQGEIMQQENVVSLMGDESIARVVSVAPATYKVKFGQRSGQRKRPLDLLDLFGSGQITINGDQVLLNGPCGRFSMGKKAQLSVPLSDIFNVEWSGLTVRFRFDGDRENLSHQVEFTAANRDDVATLRQQLPVRQTAAFARQHAELQEYRSRLMTLSPRAPVTPVLVAINVLVFVAMCVGGVGFFAPNGNDVVHWGSNFGPLTMGGQWWRLFTSLFVHFGIIHIACNMLVLLASGSLIERLFGSSRFLLLYLFAGLCGSMASLLWNPAVNSAGASGAIFGIYGGLIAFVMNSRNGVPVAVMVGQRNSALFFAFYNLVFGFAHSGIDNAAHIGGLVGGFAMGLVLARPLRKESRIGFGMPQFATGLVVAAIVLGAMSWPLGHPSAKALAEQQFQTALLDFPAQERRVVEEANAVGKKAQSGAMSGADYAGVLQRDVVPGWDHIYALVSAPKLEPGDSQYALQQTLNRYADGRRRTYRLIAQAVLQNDAALMEQAKATKADADAAMLELNKMK
ncbi:rhomboid family intramembrane serine protease [Dyella monticola]|nr:rhomboid family intramembrane serine protease [Dyella monticola]